MIFRRTTDKWKRFVATFLLAAGAVVAMKVLGTKVRSASLQSEFICSPSRSPWRRLLERGTDEAFLATTGLQRAGFWLLLSAFRRHYVHNHLTTRGGRPPRLITADALGLVLRFFVEPTSWKALAQIHGVPEGTLNRTLLKAEIALFAALRDLEDAQIRWPTLVEQAEWARLVSLKEPLVQGRWGFVDGKNLRVQKPRRQELQNAMYNGWLHAVLITGVLCFGADGCIAWARHNYVGSWNDGETSRVLQAKLMRDDMNLPGHGLLADTAFPVSDSLQGRIITPAKEGEIERAPRNQQAVLTRLSAAKSR